MAAIVLTWLVNLALTERSPLPLVGVKGALAGAGSSFRLAVLAFDLLSSAALLAEYARRPWEALGAVEAALREAGLPAGPSPAAAGAAGSGGGGKDRVAAGGLEDLMGRVTPLEMLLGRALLPSR